MWPWNRKRDRDWKEADDHARELIQSALETEQALLDHRLRLLQTEVGVIKRRRYQSQPYRGKEA